MSRSICVYLGARSGDGSAWEQAAAEAGTAIAQAGHTLVYGGGQLGLMGVVADNAINAGGKVVGVIPTALIELEQAHHGLAEQHVVENMHQRKAKLTELSDAFLVLPGGFGTLDELFEAITWRQLRFHQKPIGIWNVGGYYDALWEFLQNGRSIGFMPDTTFESLFIDSDLGNLLAKLS